jgi:hypothetical protein
MSEQTKKNMWVKVNGGPGDITVFELLKVLEQLVEQGKGHYRVSVDSEYYVLKSYCINDYRELIDFDGQP